MLRRFIPIIGCALLFAVLTSGRVAAQTSPRAAMLAQAGLAALEAGDAQAAADAFRDAIALDPKNARLRLGAGVAAFLQRRDADAREALETALTLDPKLTRARAQLGQVLRRMGDLPSAIREYERVVSEAPDDPAARETLERWRREADLHERMRFTVGDHFTVSFEGPEDAELAAEALASLTRSFWRICDLLAAYPATSIPVVLYSNEQFRDITRAPAWSAGVFDGTIRVPMRGASKNRKELDRVLAHEFVHALIRSLAARNVPVWLNEGLATALEDDEGLAWAEAKLRSAGELPLLTDLQTSFVKLPAAQVPIAYAMSARAARKLLDEGGGTVTQLLRDLGEGRDFNEAFEHRFLRPFAEFQASLLQ